MGLEVHSEPRLVDDARMGNGTLETRCRECSVTTTADQHAEGEDSLCFTCGLFSLTDRGDASPKEHSGPEPLKAPHLLENGRAALGGLAVADVILEAEANADVSSGVKGGARADAAEKATPNFVSREGPVESSGPELGLPSAGEPGLKLGVAEALGSLSGDGIGQKSNCAREERPVSDNAVLPSLEKEVPEAGAGLAKTPSFVQPVAQELRRDAQAGLCLHCKGKPVFNKKESLCKPCAHAKWRYGWDEFPPGWKPGDRLKSFERKSSGGGGANLSPGKFSASKLEQERDRVLEQGWKCGSKRERTNARSLRADRASSWSRFGEDCYPWDKPSLGGGKGVLAALLAAEGSTHLLNRKLTDSLSRKGLSPRQANPEVTQRSGIEILQAAANQERGGRTANFSRGLPRLEMVDREEEEVLARVKIMSPAALQQTAYPNEPASLVKVAVAAQVLLEIATSPRDPAHPDSKPEGPSCDQFKKPPPSRFVVPADPAASSLGTDTDDLRSRMGENQSPHFLLKYGDQEKDELPSRSPDLDEMQLAGEAVTLQDLGVVMNAAAAGGKSGAVTLPVQTGNFPPRIETEGWTPRLDADPLTLGTATDGWTPNQDLDGFTPQPESNGMTPRYEPGDVNNPRNKTPSFNDIAANVFKAGRAALAVRRGVGFRKVERPPSGDAKSKSVQGDDFAPLTSPRRRSILPQEQEATPPEEDGEDSNELSPSGNRRKRKLKARQAQERPGEGGASGEDGKPDSGASEQDAPIVSPGIHKRGRTRAVLGRNVSGNDGQLEENPGGLRAPGQATGDSAQGESKRQGRITPGKGTPVEPPKKRKGSWGGARKRGEKVVLADSDEEEAILPRIESASEGSRENRPRPAVSEDARKANSGGGGILDLVKGRWDDAQRLRDRAVTKRAEAERMKRVAEAKHRLAQRMIERATELGNWPPGRKAKADERARRQQAAKKRNAEETETEEDFEAAVCSEGYGDSEDDEEFSFDGDAYGMSGDWGEEGAGSEMDLEEDPEKAQSLDQACALPDQERCVTSDGRGWRCTRPRLPSAHNCDRHAASSQPRSQHTKSETSSRRPEETATADSCPPFVDPLEPFKPKKHFGFRERTSFRPEHLQHLALRPPGAIPDPIHEGEAARGQPPGEQPAPSREGFPNPEELLQLAKARQLKRARSARRHQSDATGPVSPRGDGSGRSPLLAGDDSPGGALSPGAVPGDCKSWGGESESEERRKRAKLSGDDVTAGASDGANRGSVEGLRDGQNANEAVGDNPRGQGSESRAEPSLPLPGGFVQMVQSAAQTEPIIGTAATRVGSARAEPGYGNLVSSDPYPSNPLSAYSLGRNSLASKPRAGPWETAGRSATVLLPDSAANILPNTGLLSEARPQNGLTSPTDVSMEGLASEQRFENGTNGERNGLHGTYFSPRDSFAAAASAEPFDNETPLGASHPLVHTATPFLMSPPAAVGDLKSDPVDQLGLLKEPKANGTNGIHRAVSKRDVYAGTGVTRSRAIEDGLPVGRTYTLPVELKLPVELRQPLEPQPFIQRGKRQTIKKKKRIPPPIDGIDDSMRCTKTGGSGWRCNQRRLEGYAKCERHMEIVAKRSRAEAKPVESVPKEDIEKKEVPVEGVM